jgi:hypothetical protein
MPNLEEVLQRQTGATPKPSQDIGEKLIEDFWVRQSTFFKSGSYLRKIVEMDGTHGSPRQ